MLDLNNSEKYDYTWARPLDVEGAADGEWERIIDSEGPYEEDGTMGPPDMFELEFSGWKRHIEFKLKAMQSYCKRRLNND